MTTPSRRTSLRKCKSAAKVNISSQALLENLSFDDCVYNTNPDAFKNNGHEHGHASEEYYEYLKNNVHESDGRRKLTFSSRDSNMESASPPGDSVKPTIVTSISTDRIVSILHAEQGKENNSPPMGNLGDETVSPGQEPKVGLAGVRAGLLTPTNESHKGQVVCQLPEEFGGRDSLPVERALCMGEMVRVLDAGVPTDLTPPSDSHLDAGIPTGLTTPPIESHKTWKRKMDGVVLNLQRGFGKRDVIRISRAFWMGEMVRVLDDVDVEFAVEQAKKCEDRAKAQMVQTGTTGA
jgi:hypothetical protein